jgi:hypothetical protein
LRRISEKAFWNLNLAFIFGMIHKTVHSLGSDKLINDVINPVCNRINTPASFLIIEGITMTYRNNLETDNIAKKIQEKDFSDLAKKVLRIQIVNYASVRHIDFAQWQKIEGILGRSKKRLPHQKKTVMGLNSLENVL